jgi:hypothetical protein
MDLAFCLGSTLAFANELTYIDILDQMIDLERLATLPAEGERCAQFSSYERDSKYDAVTKKYIKWGGNPDEDYPRLEGDKRILAEMEGPGVIWHIWSARVKSGPVKIYLDDPETPAIDLPWKKYFDLQNEPFTRPQLMHSAAPDGPLCSGLNLYVPICYQKSCKITAEGLWADSGAQGHYYLYYTTYPKGTRVPTFKRALAPEDSRALDRIDTVLANCGVDPTGKRVGEVTERRNITVLPGKTVEVLKVKGRRAITALRVHPDLPAPPADREVLRELALSIFWDGDSDPAVWSPLGDFFGTAIGKNNYKSLPMGVTDENFYSFWYMPFKDGAIIQITNDGDQARKIEFTVTHAPLSRPIEQLGRFHAKWHRDAFNPERVDRWPDWTLLTTTGRGRFCGVMLHVWNPGAAPCTDPKTLAAIGGCWWGEGDEKFFVDGENFPSSFGTGTEDYFGYACGDPTLFSHAYHNMTLCGDSEWEIKNFAGHMSMNRWHIMDNIPFQKSFEGAIEKYYPNEFGTLYAAIAYWYLAPGGVDPYKPVPVSERKGYWTAPIESR